MPNVAKIGHRDALIDLWADDLVRERGRAKSTACAYMRQVRSALSDIGGEISAISPRQLRDLVKRRFTEGYEPSTRRQLVAALRGFFGWCEEDAVVDRSPAMRLKGPSAYHKEPTTLTRLETAKIVYGPQPGHLPEDPLAARDRVLIAVSYWCALRSEEPGLLDVEAIDESSGRPSVQIERRKGARRDIRLEIFDDMTTMMLQAYLMHHRPQLVDDAHAGPIFPATRGPRAGAGLSARHARRIFDSLRQAAGIRPRGRHLSFHALRHTWATHALELGADLVDIQDHLGHQSIETTRRYIGRRSQRELSRRVYRPLLSTPSRPPIARFADELGRHLEQAAGR